MARPSWLLLEGAAIVFLPPDGIWVARRLSALLGPFPARQMAFLERIECQVTAAFTAPRVPISCSYSQFNDLREYCTMGRASFGGPGPSNRLKHVAPRHSRGELMGLKIRFSGVTAILLLATTLALAAPKPPKADSKGLPAFPGTLVNARYIYVTSYDGDQ